MKFTTSFLMICTGFINPSTAAEYQAPRIIIEKSLDVDEVPSSFPVGFSLLTADKIQYLAYYDKDQNMKVASRALGSNQWRYQTLPSRIGWDTHNYITMSVDDGGHLHVTGNMHGDPLIYFRTEQAGDITTLKQFPMTGKREKRVTYPKFLRDHENKLIFNYRDGGSGNGMRIYNQYDPSTGKWSRLLGTPLLDGEGQRNAYPAGPVRGPDGWFHMIWVWRDTPDCATNHHLSYVRSKDLIHWESAFGEKIELPLKLSHQQLWVDPIPSGGGIINGGAKLSFDSQKRPMISYHKSDANGNMQIYVARPKKNVWASHLLTNWSKPVNFSGNGSMGFIGIRISPLDQIEPGMLTLSFRHRHYGAGRIVVDEKTLKPIHKKITIPPTIPKKLNQIQSDFKGMGIRRAYDSGYSGNDAVTYLLQWETLGPNQDKPRKPPLPKPSMLKLYKIIRQ